MRITVVEDNNGKTCSIFNPGWVVTYSNEFGKWAEINRFENPVPKAQGIAGVRAALNEAVDGIKGKVIVALEIPGIAFSVFESAGFESYTVDAQAADVLEPVKAETEAAKAKQEKKPADIQSYLQQGKRPGEYFLDLHKMLGENLQLTTKGVLLPYLRQGGFAALDIVFGHVPPWFDAELAAMGLAYEVVDTLENKKTIRIERTDEGGKK